jgi:hypothetical protein
MNVMQIDFLVEFLNKIKNSRARLLSNSWGKRNNMKAYGTVEISFCTFLISTMTSQLHSPGTIVSRSS